MTGLSVGSLFSGYDGIGCALRSVLGAEPVWFCEHDPKAKSQSAAKVLTHHWPDVPNLGDITGIDWSSTEPVDIISGGFPCQDLSLAGKRAGMTEGTRSGLWSHMATAIETLRPEMVIAENVRGLLSGKAHRMDEQCPGCVDDGPGGHVRALGVVLGDLARIGYDAQWIGLRAADVGAPHQRYRIFVIAHLADTDSVRRQRDRDARRWRQGSANNGVTAADTDGARLPGDRPVGSGSQMAGAAGDRPVPIADTGGLGRQWRSGVGGDGRDAEQRSQESDHAGDRSASRIDWGKYEPAIRRWEQLTRVAPRPTEAGARGAQRLSPAFVEWMQGLPIGHVTDPAIGLTRAQQLQVLGNGVVPQQAAAAIRHLLQVAQVAA